MASYRGQSSASTSASAPGSIFELLRQIEERHFGPIELLDQGEDVPDSDLLNGFLDAYNEESETGTIYHR